MSKTTTKLNIKEDITDTLEDENVSQIVKSAEKSDNVIIAWGRLGENNKAVQALQEKLLEHLKPYEDKLYMICDDNGEVGFHPLAPNIRFIWNLSRYEIPNKQGESAEPKKQKNTKKKQSHESDLPVQETKTEEIT